MHHIQVTEGVVLRKKSSGEANTRITLLTKEMGLLNATARSARKEESKLRFGLEQFTVGRFSLVKGHYEWKITGVEAATRHALSASTKKRRQIGRITGLILRLVHGEDLVPGLYELLVSGFTALEPLENEDAEAVECIIVLRILERLGYLPYKQELQVFLEEQLPVSELLQEASIMRPKLIRTINESLIASGL